MAKKPAAATPALKMLDDAGITYSTHSYDSAGTDFGTEAAQIMRERLNIAARRIFKTLIVHLSGTKRDNNIRGAAANLAVAMVPVDSHVDLKAVANALGASKATMADPHLAQKTTGYVLGGVSPLAQKRQLSTVIDVAAQDAITSGETIFFSAGKRGLEIEMEPAKLIALLEARCAPIAAR